MALLEMQTAKVPDADQQIQEMRTYSESRYSAI
jgi:hypothetical protein